MQPDNGQPTAITPQAKSKLPIIIVVIAVFVAVAGVAVAILVTRDSTDSDGGDKNGTSKTDDGKSGDGDEGKDKPSKNEDYKAEKHGFSIAFESAPRIEDVSQPAGNGLDMEAVQYLDLSASGNEGYMVQVSKYTRSNGAMIKAAEFNDRTGLDGAIGAMSSSGGIKLISSTNKGTFMGKYSSADAELEAEGKVVYVKAFVKHDDTVYAYVIMSIGKSRAEFEAFIESFKFIES